MYKRRDTGQLSKSDVVFAGVAELQSQLDELNTSLVTLKSWPSLSDEELQTCERILDESVVVFTRIRELTRILHSQSDE